MIRRILHGLIKQPKLKEGECATVTLSLLLLPFLLVDGSVEEDCTVKVHPGQYSAYNSVCRGHNLTLSCSTKLDCYPVWNIIINDNASAGQDSKCSGGLYGEEPIIGDLECATSSINNGSKITISMTVNHSTVLQCETTTDITSRSKPFAFFVHCDDICPEYPVASSTSSPNVSCVPVTLSSFLPSLSTLSPSTSTTMKMEPTANSSLCNVTPSSSTAYVTPSSSMVTNPISSSAKASTDIVDVSISMSQSPDFMVSRVTTEPSASSAAAWLTALTGTGLVVLLVVILPLIVVLLILIFRSYTQQFKKTPMTSDKTQKISNQSFTVENTGARQEETDDI